MFRDMGLARAQRARLGRGGIGEGHYLQRADGLARMEPEKFWEVVMKCHPDFRATSEGGDTPHEGGQPRSRAEVNIFVRPWIAAANDTGGIGWNVGSLEERGTPHLWRA